MNKIMHLVVSVSGLKKRVYAHIQNPEKRINWQVLEKNGKLLNEIELIKEIERCEKAGYEVIPSCENINELGYCLGHEVKEEAND